VSTPGFPPIEGQHLLVPSRICVQRGRSTSTSLTTSTSTSIQPLLEVPHPKQWH